MAQEVANKLGAKLTVDGELGSKTVDALNEIDSAYFLAEFQNDIKAWFTARAKKKPSQKVFLAGWLNRASRYSMLA